MCIAGGDWSLCNEDLFPSKLGGRYYGKQFQCRNCNERGHKAENCPKPKVTHLVSLTGRMLIMLVHAYKVPTSTFALRKICSLLFREEICNKAYDWTGEN